MEGEVVELEPPRRFAFTWGDDVLRIELERRRRRLPAALHPASSTTPSAPPATPPAGTSAWTGSSSTSAARRPTRRDSEPTPDWRELYEEYQRRGLPAGAPVPGG